MRATQKLVDQMGWVFSRPSLTALEIAWRWVFGLPLLIVLAAGSQILAALPPESTGLGKSSTNRIHGSPSCNWRTYGALSTACRRMFWVAAAPGCGGVGGYFGRGPQPRPVRLDRGVRFRPFSMMALQAGWLAVLGTRLVGWFRSIQWVAATHIGAGRRGPT